MGGETQGTGSWPPAPSGAPQRDVDQWTHFDNSVNAVSFGFLATAILISMFLVMAIFEKFLRTASPDIEAAPGRAAGGGGADAKLGHLSPKISMNAREVSVVMPGENVPTFLAHPAPVPCPPERHVQWPSLHRQPSYGQCLPSSSSTR